MKVHPVEDSTIEKLKREIEAQLNWGEISQWRNKDFSDLSERIWERTHVRLSPTTLKRIWGKVNYDSQPTTKTLDALAQFGGYEHWRDFLIRAQKETHAQDINTELELEERPFRNFRFPPNVFFKRNLFVELSNIRYAISPQFISRMLAISCAGVLLIGTIFMYRFWIFSEDLRVDSSKIIFYSEPVTQGIPNTVIFHFDVSHLSDRFPISIQQSWDSRLRREIHPSDTSLTTTYYSPGYFRAKLLYNERLIKSHDIYVRSDGWMAIIDRFPIPLYLSNLQQSNGILSVSVDQLKKEEIIQNDSVPWLVYYYVDDLGDISSNTFTLETAIKSDFNEGDAICQESHIGILCSKGRFNVPFVIPGCVGTINLVAGDKYIDGKKEDLSSLGSDLSQWQPIRIQLTNKNVYIFRNEKQVYQTSYSEDVGKIVGFRYRFRGAGSVQYIRLKDENQAIIFEDYFD